MSQFIWIICIYVYMHAAWCPLTRKLFRQPSHIFMTCKCVKGIKRNPVPLVSLSTPSGVGDSYVGNHVGSHLSIGTQKRAFPRGAPYLWRNDRPVIIDSVTKTTFCLSKQRAAVRGHSYSGLSSISEMNRRTVHFTHQLHVYSRSPLVGW